MKQNMQSVIEQKIEHCTIYIYDESVLSMTLKDSPIELRITELRTNELQMNQL
jgi:hypothetical protein